MENFRPTIRIFFQLHRIADEKIMEKLFSLVLKILLCILQQCCCRRARLKPNPHRKALSGDGGVVRQQNVYRKGRKLQIAWWVNEKW